MSTYQVLRRARRLIKKGWAQGVSQDRLPRGVSYCTIGAISFAAIGEHDHQAAFDKACSALRNLISPDHESPISLVSWNDDKGQTKEHVLNMFGAAVERARQQLPWWQRIFTTSE